jgi:hypothetical protein
MTEEKWEQAIRRRIEKQLGYPLPEGDWDLMQEIGLKELGLYAGDLDGDPLLRKEAEPLFDDLAYFYGNIERPDPPTAKATSAAKESKRKMPSRKSIDRRVHLVNFVLNYWAFTKRPRINWNQVTKEWNETHEAYNGFERPASFMMAYNRGIRNDFVKFFVVLSQIKRGFKAMSGDVKRFDGYFISMQSPATKQSALYKYLILDNPDLRQLGLVTIIAFSKRKEAKNDD